MSYLTLAVPVALVETAKRVSQALDPDLGGYEAFQSRATNESGSMFAVYGFPCSDEFAAQAMYLQANPAALAQAVTADPRWDTALTEADAEAFCAGLQTSAAYGMEAGLSEMGLTLEVAE